MCYPPQPRSLFKQKGLDRTKARKAAKGARDAIKENPTEDGLAIVNRCIEENRA